MRFILLIAPLLVVSLTRNASATDAKVLDTTGQKLDLTDVKSDSKPARPYLTVVTETWTFDIPFSIIKVAQRDEKTKKEKTYGPTPFAITLTTGTTIKGTVGMNVSGESDFGKATAKHDGIKSITFTQSSGDPVFKPDTAGSSATVTDRGGGEALPLTAVEFRAYDKVVKELEGTRGAVTLIIATADIQKLDYVGEVKQGDNSKAKWLVSLASGKSTELLLDRDYLVHGEFASGEATLSTEKLKSLIIVKKKSTVKKPAT